LTFRVTVRREKKSRLSPEANLERLTLNFEPPVLSVGGLTVSAAR